MAGGCFALDNTRQGRGRDHELHRTLHRTKSLHNPRFEPHQTLPPFTSNSIKAVKSTSAAPSGFLCALAALAITHLLSPKSDYAAQFVKAHRCPLTPSSRSSAQCQPWSTPYPPSYPCHQRFWSTSWPTCCSLQLTRSMHSFTAAITHTNNSCNVSSMRQLASSSETSPCPHISG
jgi:hypothetical protein